MDKLAEMAKELERRLENWEDSFYCYQLAHKMLDELLKYEVHGAVHFGSSGWCVLLDTEPLSCLVLDSSWYSKFPEAILSVAKRILKRSGHGEREKEETPQRGEESITQGEGGG